VEETIPFTTEKGDGKERRPHRGTEHQASTKKKAPKKRNHRANQRGRKIKKRFSSSGIGGILSQIGEGEKRTILRTLCLPERGDQLRTETNITSKEKTVN